MPKLYFHPASQNSRKVVALIQELKAPIDLAVIDVLSGENFKPPFTRINPNSMVPVLEDKDLVLWESNSIMRYLCEAYGGKRFWPEDVKKRADVSRWMDWQLAHWNPACQLLTWENLVKGLCGMGAPDPVQVKVGEEDFRYFAAILDSHLKGRKFLVGDTATLADLAVGAAMTYWGPARMPVAEFKEIVKWYGRLEAMESWKKSAPPMGENTKAA